MVLFLLLAKSEALDWNAKLEAVRRCRVACRDFPAVSNIRFADAMLPNLLLIHLCEHAQCVQDPELGSKKIKVIVGKALEVDPQQRPLVAYKPTIARVLAELDEEKLLRRNAGGTGSIQQILMLELWTDHCKVGRTTARASSSAGGESPAGDATSTKHRTRKRWSGTLAPREPAAKASTSQASRAKASSAGGGARARIPMKRKREAEVCSPA